jgi:hypothetical protein
VGEKRLSDTIDGEPQAHHIVRPNPMFRRRRNHHVIPAWQGVFIPERWRSDRRRRSDRSRALRDEVGFRCIRPRNERQRNPTASSLWCDCDECKLSSGKKSEWRAKRLVEPASGAIYPRRRDRKHGNKHRRSLSLAEHKDPVAKRRRTLLRQQSAQSAIRRQIAETG